MGGTEEAVQAGTCLTGAGKVSRKRVSADCVSRSLLCRRARAQLRCLYVRGKVMQMDGLGFFDTQPRKKVRSATERVEIPTLVTLRSPVLAPSNPFCRFFCSQVSSAEHQLPREQLMTTQKSWK